MSDFKIGDKVLFQGFKCGIIADKKTPHRQHPMADLFPFGGNDFVLERYFTEQDIVNKVPFIDYLHVLKSEIRHWEE